MNRTQLRQNNPQYNKSGHPNQCSSDDLLFILFHSFYGFDLTERNIYALLFIDATQKAILEFRLL